MKEVRGYSSRQLHESLLLLTEYRTLFQKMLGGLQLVWILPFSWTPHFGFWSFNDPSSAKLSRLEETFEVAYRLVTS